MKKLAVWLLCALLCTSLCPALTACKSYGKPSAQTHGPDAAASESATAMQAENAIDPADRTYDPDLYVVIRTAEDLMAFQRAVNRDGYAFDGMTVVFLNDIDMADYEWEPLDGAKLSGVTFDGRGHTVSRLRFSDYAPASELLADEKGCGFVGVATGDLTFRDLTLSHTAVKAYDHSVGNFVGSVVNARVTFSNCSSVGFTAEGWMDWIHRDPAQGGHAVAMRLGGFVGCIGEDGEASFDGCAVENLTLSGFHNLACFVGYDVGGALNAADFTNCAVANARITFSYCLAEGYTADQPKKFVSVFFNSRDFADTTAPCTAAGNTYTDVCFYDWADDGTPYTPEQFLSHPQEEADNHEP